VSESLDGKVALVTGASRGIGRAIALALAGAGAEVACAARTEKAAARTVSEIESAGGRGVALAMDVGDDESVERGVASLIERYGKIALLVNNAGVTRDTLILRMKREDWDTVLGTNLTGAYRVCRTVVPNMIRGKYGRIVNVSSVVGSIGNPGQTNYAASKAGLEGFTRSLAREVASRNITVNCVAPGFIDTDMTRDLGEDARAALTGQIPLKRLGTSEDVASAVLFLLGAGGSYITGTTLHVNGGMFM
jgi:3-oxoacyl-[acyl-carrier protein] reductase